MRDAKKTLIAGLLMAFAWIPARPAQDTPQKAQVVADHGMVASADTVASQAGLEILKAGGNAIDAAVAAAFAIGVVEPDASGIGGGGVMVLYRADKDWTVAIDYCSAAPAEAKSAASTGYAAAAVPGTVAGLNSALKQYGTMKLERVMRPAIRLADEGFTVSPTLAAAIAGHSKEIMEDPPLAAILCPDGVPAKTGTTLRNPDLATVLRAIATHGPDFFYKGELAQAIAATTEQHGGIITLQDLSRYQARSREPVRGYYRGYSLISAPPPAGGTSVIEIMQVLERFDLAGNAPVSPVNIHLLSESMKRGFADFDAFIADPDFEAIPLAGLLSREYARKRAADIRLDAISSQIPAGAPEKNGSGNTTTLCAIDRRGNAAVITQTLSDDFGARVAVPGTGIILNNEMKDFSTRGVNAPASGKRMRTASAPTILLKDGRIFAALGTTGAERMLSTTAIFISNLIDHRMGIQEAIESPRFYGGSVDRKLSVESRIAADVISGLNKLGYTIQTMGAFDLYFGAAQGILVDAKTGRKTGGADPRRNGAVAGY